MTGGLVGVVLLCRIRAGLQLIKVELVYNLDPRSTSYITAVGRDLGRDYSGLRLKLYLMGW
jgi:hypothetical protein